MSKTLLSAPLVAVCVAAALAQPARRPVDEFATSAGSVRITVVNHATMMVEGGGSVIHVDPVGAPRYAALPQADLVLICHTHPDHLDAAAVERVKKAGTVVLGPESVAKALPGTTVIRNGESRQVGRWRVEAVPAYNLTRGPAPGAFYHPKGDGNGYVLTLGDKRFYIAGDTENIPELAALKNIEAAFLPVNLPFTMTPEEAAAAARAVRPKYRVPVSQPRIRSLDPEQGARRQRDRGAAEGLVSGRRRGGRRRSAAEAPAPDSVAKAAGGARRRAAKAGPAAPQPAAARPAPVVSPRSCRTSGSPSASGRRTPRR